MATKHIAVIGAGPMGLMAAYQLLKKGYHVSLYERDDRIGGMSASFDFEGTKIERFYHFICKPDQPMFDLLAELQLSDKLVWRDTKMAFYYEGKLYPWGDPISLLKFPRLSFIDKFRYGLMVWTTSKIKDWRKLDKIGVTTWLKKWLGEKCYNVLWKSLFYYKFYQYKDDLSAAWLGTRIKRVGLSRKNIFQESLGYLQGGSDTLLNVMEDKIKQLGGAIVLNADVQQVVVENNAVVGIKVAQELMQHDAVVSTIPLPYVSKLVPDFSHQVKQKIEAIKNVGVVCVLFKLKQAFSEYFWMNINDQRIELPGIIEYSNLNPSDEKILYVPYYMPADYPKNKWSDQQFVSEAINYLKTIKPEFSESEIIATKVTRYAFAQTVCGTDFYNKLPPMRSEVSGFYMADTAYYYPEDRSISESVQIGKQLAELVDEDHH